MAFSFIKLISYSGTSTKREAAVKKIGPPTIFTTEEVIIAEYDAILSQWEPTNFYNHLSNYTKCVYWEARLLFNFSFFEVPLSYFESTKQSANKMEFQAPLVV